MLTRLSPAEVKLKRRIAAIKEQDPQLALAIEEAVRAKFKSMTTAVGHDLRAQVSVMKVIGDSWCALVESPEDVEDWARHYELIENVLDDMKEYGAATELTFERVDVGVVINMAVRAIRAQFRGSGKQVSLNKPTAKSIADLSVVTDRTRLMRVVQNLLKNAHEASHSGGVVRITAQATDEGVKIRVADKGKGIPKSVLAKMFEPGFTTKRTRGARTDNTGFGLALVSEYVQDCGGTLKVDTEWRKGTTITLLFPTNVSETT